MMIDKNDKNILKHIIMEHFVEPDFKGLIENENAITLLQESPTCSDEINVQLLIEDNKIVDAKFNGQACAIATAATDIICSQLINLSKEQALKKLNNYHNMILGNKYDEQMLDELIAFWKINEQSNRINCALLGVDGFQKILNKEG